MQAIQPRGYPTSKDNLCAGNSSCHHRHRPSGATRHRPRSVESSSGLGTSDTTRFSPPERTRRPIKVTCTSDVGIRSIAEPIISPVCRQFLQHNGRASMRAPRQAMARQTRGVARSIGAIATGCMRPFVPRTNEDEITITAWLGVMTLTMQHLADV